MAEKYQTYQGIVLGYYQIRGKIQICRLLCQYLHIPYLDLFFSPQSWQQFKLTQTKNWNFQELPFMKHKDIVITQTFPICLYLINLANRTDLLGQTLQDQVKIDMFVWDTQMMSQILCVMINLKNQCIEKRKQIFQKFWQQNIKPKLIKLQQQVTGKYYLSYLTIIDFYIYDLFYYLNSFGCQNLNCFPKLFEIYKEVASIPQIITYQTAQKAVKQTCPFEFCQKWKQKINKAFSMEK